MARLLNLAIGIVLGLIAIELALRLTTYEHEADGNYWGRGAFVADDECGYRHAPSTTAVSGRQGVFGPLTTRTNAAGYRDQRLPERFPDSGPRLAIVGSSIMFGLGVEDDDAVFAVQLERRLRERDDLPADLEVLNLSQTGYLVRELEVITRREVPRVGPRMVLLVLTPSVRVSRMGDGSELDVVGGYRLPTTRPWRGSWFDELRTGSLAFMRIARSPLLEPGAFLDGQLLAELPGLAGGPPPRQAPATTRGTRRDVVRHVKQIHRFLRERDIAFAVMVIYRPWHDDHWLGPALAGEPFPVFDVDSPADWLLGADGHWTADGHAAAAEFIAPLIPAAPFR